MPMNKANKEPVILGLVTSSLIRHENKQEKSRGKVYVRTSSLWAVRRGLLGTFLCMEDDQSVGSWGGPGSEVCRQSSSNVMGRPDGLALLQLHTGNGLHKHCREETEISEGAGGSPTTSRPRFPRCPLLARPFHHCVLHREDCEGGPVGQSLL